MVHVFSENIDLLEEHNVFFHNSCILLLVYILVLLKHSAQAVNAVLKVLSSVCVLLMNIGVARLVFELFLYIFLVKPDHSSP